MANNELQYILYKNNDWNFFDDNEQDKWLFTLRNYGKVTTHYGDVDYINSMMTMQSTSQHIAGDCSVEKIDDHLSEITQPTETNPWYINNETYAFNSTLLLNATNNIPTFMQSVYYRTTSQSFQQITDINVQLLYNTFTIESSTLNGKTVYSVTGVDNIRFSKDLQPITSTTNFNNTMAVEDLKPYYLTNNNTENEYVLVPFYFSGAVASYQASTYVGGTYCSFNNTLRSAYQRSNIFVNDGSVPCYNNLQITDFENTYKYLELNDLLYQYKLGEGGYSNSAGVNVYFTKLEQALLFCAQAGLKFIANYNGDSKLYKPVVEGGLVTGYTEDFTSHSEFDDWETIDHENAGGLTPGGKGGIDKDDLNDFPLDDAGGVCRYYALDTYDLSELNSSLYVDTAGVPLNPSDFIVGLWLLPIDLNQFCSGIETIKLGTHSINASGSRMTTTRKVIDMGTMNISQHFNGTFLDFAPYTEVSVYVPYCGMVHLPTALCMNNSSNSVNVKLVIDALSGACKGIVSINGTVYTSINGSMMSSIPISAEQCATKAQTTISACVNALSGIIGATSYSATASSGSTDIFNKGAMTASLHTSGMSTQQGYNINPIGAGVNAISSIGNSMITYNNIAPDYIAGSTDSSVNYYMPQYCKLFISYPKVDMGDIAHTHGKVCNYQDTLGNCSGFTVVSRPHLNITCTNEERDEIKSLLESGVIL